MVGALHAAARNYANLGMPVFPLQPKGKAPATVSGVKQATTDLAVIDRWWTTAPDMNIGLATGSVAGVFVVDVDAEAGETTIRELERANGAFPPTVESITGNGRHLWFRLGDHDSIRNSAGKIGLEFVDFLSSEEGIPLYKDHEYTLISIYNNRSDEKQDAMASMFLYMLDWDFEEASKLPGI